MIENIGAYSQVDYDRGYQQGRADTLKQFEDIYIHNIALDYERPTMPMLMNFWNEFGKLTNEQLKKMNKRGD